MQLKRLPNSRREIILNKANEKDMYIKKENNQPKYAPIKLPTPTNNSDLNMSLIYVYMLSPTL